MLRKIKEVSKKKMAAVGLGITAAVVGLGFFTDYAVGKSEELKVAKKEEAYLEEVRQTLDELHAVTGELVEIDETVSYYPNMIFDPDFRDDVSECLSDLNDIIKKVRAMKAPKVHKEVQENFEYSMNAYEYVTVNYGTAISVPQFGEKRRVYDSWYDGNHYVEETINHMEDPNYEGSPNY